MIEKLTAFGLWKSPITTTMVAERNRLLDVQWNSDGKTLIWLEQRSGNGVLVSWSEESGRHDMPSEDNIRGGIGYGGGEFTICNGDIIYTSNGKRFIKRGLNGGPPFTIMPSLDNIASPVISPDGHWVIFVYSDGKMDLLGLADATGKQWPFKLAQATDFYMQPVWHPSGRRVAWVEWDHPNMPWDGTRLMLGEIKGSRPHIVKKEWIAGDDRIPVSQPRFSPGGKWLSFIEANNDWDDLVLFNMETRERQVLIKGDHFLLTPPAWTQGVRSYSWSHSGERIYQIRSFGGVETLWEIDLNAGVSRQIHVEPYSSIRQLTISPRDDQLAFIGSGFQSPEAIVVWRAGLINAVNLIEGETISPDLLPKPQHVTWKSKEGDIVYGLYYPPTNPAYESDGLPPAVISIHGGPTSLSSVCYDVEIAYFTSRGYAWMEVNYRGSTGYGHSYRKALEGNWGDLDVEDAVGAAYALIDKKLADANRLILHGSSAGGFTILNALCCYPERFKAGICLYGISNLFTALRDSPKFEAHYFDRLIGELPDVKEKFYARSVVYHASQIRSPLAIFQGGADSVVLPEQSEEIVLALRENNVPHVYRLYPDEGHGFRKTETINDMLKQVEIFLKRHVLKVTD